MPDNTPRPANERPMPENFSDTPSVSLAEVPRNGTTEYSRDMGRNFAPARYPYRYPLNEPDGFGSGFTLRDFLSILRNRRAIALNTFIVVVAMGLVLTTMTAPKFQTGVSMMVQEKSSTISIANSSDPLTSILLPPVGRDVNTQVELLRSPAMLNKVYKQAGVTQGTVDLEVRQRGTTAIIDATATSENKDAALKFAKALPEVYLDDISRDRLQELNSALEFAKKRLADQTAKLTKAEFSMESFKKRAGVIDPQGQRAEDIEAATLARANARQAEADASKLRAQLNTLIAERSRMPEFTETPVTTPNSEIQALRSRISDLKTERNDQLFIYKPNSDEIKRIDTQIANLESRLRNTPSTVTGVTRAPNLAIAQLDSQIRETRSSLDAANASWRTLQSRAASLDADLSRYNPIERVSSQLQREIADARQNVSLFSKSVEDLTLRYQALRAQNAPVTVIQEAGPPGQISPQPMRNMVLAVMLGFVLACGMALLQNSLDDHVNDEDEARRLLGMPVLGYLPKIGSGKSEQRPLLDPQNPNTVQLESFRMLRSNVRFALVNGPERSLLVTSTVAEEGKSTTASNLAIAMAMDGRRIILVDSDMRRPKLDLVFSLPRQPGLSNVLVGQISVQEALHETDVPNLRVLTAGALPPNPAELLSSPALDALLTELQGECDMVLFDTPPAPATADTQVLASKVDGVLYVIHLGRVRKAGVQHSFELLRQANARVLGVVFNKFEANQGNYYEYSYGYGYHADEDGPKLDTDGESPLPKLKSKNSSAKNNGASANGASTNGAGNGVHHNEDGTLITQLDENARKASTRNDKA